jgi:CO/xanthine dehydrogenase Mo-binding subunit
MTVTRRTFVKTLTIGTTAVVIMKWPPPAEAAGAAADPVQPPASPGWGPVAGQARYRIDGIPKVTGQKIFARDFHPNDIPGWPAKAKYAYVLRAIHADRTVTGIALAQLPASLKPSVVITQADLDTANMQTPFGDMPGPIMVELNSVPYYLGQPVAILIFDSFDAFSAASRLMQFDPSFLTYGPVTTPRSGVAFEYVPSWFIRYSEDGQEVFSQVTAEAFLDPTSNATLADCQSKTYLDKIESTIKAHPDWRLFESKTSTQTIDTMFMEPQTGMAYMRNTADGLTLDLLLGTQSPNGDASIVCSLLGTPSVHPARINLYSCYMGGGFGGRDTSLFTPLLAIAAAFTQGSVVRLENDRFGQFQGGIKRNGSEIKQTFAVDGSGKLMSVRSDMTIVGGGKQNYSPFVAELAGICGAGAYATPMNVIYATAIHTIGPTAGSMRGFGGPQAFFAVEHLMDEIAASMKIDPIELRKRNVLAENGHTVTGAPILQPLPLREICDMASANPLWIDREKEKKRRAGGDTAYGVGFAIANQAFGTGNDGVFGRVELASDGAIAVTTNAVDMGNGAATSLALAPARWLGANAASIEMGNIVFSNVLNLTQSESGSACEEQVPCPPLANQSLKMPAANRGLHPRRASRRRQAAAAVAPPPPAPSTCVPNSPYTNPWTANDCYTSAVYMSSSACITAFHHTHVIEQASRVVFMAGIWPAALKLWNAPPSTDPSSARWENGSLITPGNPPLPLARLAAEAHALGATTGATVHGCYEGMWVAADYTIGAMTLPGYPIDALAIRTREGPYTRLPRKNVQSPPPQAMWYGRSLYAPSGTLAAVEIEKRTGQVRLVDVVTYVDAGRPIQRQLLEGQYEGAVAMGFGYTFLEHLPQTVGDGTWNLNRYGLAMAYDLPPLERMKLVPIREDGTPRGISEAVLCPIAPALANAASSATGKFYRSLPITMQQLMETLS